MKYLLLKYRLKSRFSRKQKAAIAGKIPMTKELFRSCLDVAHSRLDREVFREIWSTYPQYAQEFREACKREISCSDSSDRAWTVLRSKLAKEFGEDWVRMHFRD